MNIKYETIEFLQRMKYYIALSTIIFVGFLLISYYYPSFFNSLMLPVIESMQNGINNGEIMLETMALFNNNFSVALNIFEGGLFFSVPSIYLLAYNAVVIGYVGANLPLGYYLSYTVPHGVFELTAIVLSGASAFRLTHGIVKILSGINIKADDRSKYFTEKLETGIKMCFDAVIMMIFITILLFVAAFIEANLTIPIGSLLYP